MATLQPLLPLDRRNALAALSAPAPAPVSLSGMGGAAPALAPLLPQTPVVDNPRLAAVSADPLITRKSQAESDLYRRENPIAPTTTLGKIGHVAANIGNVLGNIFAPAEMALIHGTQLNNEIEKNRDRGDIQDVSQLQTAEAGRKQQEALTAYTEQRPEIEQAKLQQKMDIQRVRSDQAAAKAGQRPVEDENGVVSYVDDPNSAAFQSRKIHDETEQARQSYLDAQEEVDRTKNDPNSPAYKLAVTRAQIAKQNASAAITRAQAYYGNYLKGAFNKDLQGNVLPGAPQIIDEAGNVTTPGTSNAAQAVKANANAAQFGDVFGALGSAESAAHALASANGGKLNSPGVAAALAHPPSQIREWLQGEGVKANLTPQERDYVTSMAALHENIQAMRKAAGGSSTDSSVAKLDALVPGISTPDLDYFLRQTGQIRSTASRLGRGIATAKGGLTISGHGSDQKQPDTTPSSTPRPPNVPEGYVLRDGPKGKGWYNPHATH